MEWANSRKNLIVLKWKSTQSNLSLEELYGIGTTSCMRKLTFFLFQILKVQRLSQLMPKNENFIQYAGICWNKIYKLNETESGFLV